MSSQDQSHARKNILTGEWVLVSPHRTLRPWQGQTESISLANQPEYDPACYLCSGNERANGERNPEYIGPYIFDNDFPALSAASTIESSGNPLFEARTESGRCRVVCFSEKHNERLSTMTHVDMARALTVLIDEFSTLSTSGLYEYVQVFENRGEMMGCSNQHPHGQIWATEHLPTEITKELASQRAHYHASGSALLMDYLDAELTDGARIIAGNEHFVAVVPYWATWPFEQMILPRRHVTSPDNLSDLEIKSLASLLKSSLGANDRLFNTSAPYSMGLHAAPCQGSHPEWQFHVHIYPPLLRSATIKKHLVGFELLGMPQRDLTPEVAAERLRASVDA
ncbi:MAG: UDP-glucose--hexose-1-phosphate uridylyltransferase [Woeseiaceae bacterium]|nr:UDP-glucose--hexose-1-phosphate uridylyltransferase [Woeseiaceae bacterium]